MIVDTGLPVIVETMIDNILIAAEEGQEDVFCQAVRLILHRIAEANLLTSPPREEVLSWSDHMLLEHSRKDCLFLGEEYSWIDGQRQVRNSVKTVTKLDLASQAPAYSYRSFAALISLICYAVHTTSINPAELFPLLRMYQAIFRTISHGKHWDDVLVFISPSIRNTVQTLVQRLVLNPFTSIPDPIGATYDDADYDVIIYTDASIGGLGGIAKGRDGSAYTFQRRWTHDVQAEGPLDAGGAAGPFSARFSAHAEPRAAQEILQYIFESRLFDFPIARIALVTDHEAIVTAQRGENGFRGIGRGYALNNLYKYTNFLFLEHNVRIIFFQIAGGLNPADVLSRNFGDCEDGRLSVRRVENVGVPSLLSTRCPLCETPVTTNVHYGDTRPRH
eukprot:gene5761-biopygen3629